MTSLFSNTIATQILIKAGRVFRFNIIAPLFPDRIRYGNDFNSTYAMLKKTQFKSRRWLKQYQTLQLRHLIHMAYERTPYYRRLFKANNILPSEIQTSEDIARIPILTKSDIVKGVSDFIVRGYPSDRIKHVTTGGSTGVPTDLYWDCITTNEREWAFIRTLWDRIGYSERAKAAIIRGAFLDDKEFPNHYQYHWATRRLVLSSFHLDSPSMATYVSLLQHFQPTFYQAYPSSMAILSRFIMASGLEVPRAKAIILASEKPNSDERRLVEKIFQCRTFSFYGHTERVVLAGECEHSRHYHVFPEYGVTEIVSKDNTPITEPGETGSIVGTGFINTVMPLIRFDTEDISEWIDATCQCGREYPILSQVEGRRSDSVVISFSGRPVSTAALNPHEGFLNKASMFQFVQSRVGEITLLLVPGKSFIAGDENTIAHFFRERLGPGFSLSIEIVDNIEPTESGKRNMLKQKLTIEQYT